MPRPAASVPSSSTSSASIDADACEIEQPAPSQVTSRTVSPLDAHAEGDLVAADRVALVGCRGRALVVGEARSRRAALGVVEDELLVQRFEAAHRPAPKNARTPATASRNRSISASVL